MAIGKVADICKLRSYLNDYYLDIDDNVYLLFRWIEENEDFIVRVNGIGQLTMYQYYNYIERMGLQDTKEIRDEFIQIWESSFNL